MASPERWKKQVASPDPAYPLESGCLHISMIPVGQQLNRQGTKNTKTIDTRENKRTLLVFFLVSLVPSWLKLWLLHLARCDEHGQAP